jgi:hypothetical protein
MPEKYWSFESAPEPTGDEKIDQDELYSEKFKSLRDNPEAIVREVEYTALYKILGTQETLALAKEEFNSLREKFDIAVKADYVIAGKNENESSVWGITDRVYEDTVEEIEIKKAQGELIEKILGYCTDKLNTFNPETKEMDYFIDNMTSLKQYVYGHTAEDTKSKYHLVDIDPKLERGLWEYVYALNNLYDEGLDEYMVWAKENDVFTDDIKKQIAFISNTLRKISQHLDDDRLRQDIEEFRKKSMKYFLT